MVYSKENRIIENLKNPKIYEIRKHYIIPSSHYPNDNGADLYAEG